MNSSEFYKHKSWKGNILIAACLFGIFQFRTGFILNYMLRHRSGRRDTNLFTIYEFLDLNQPRWTVKHGDILVFVAAFTSYHTLGGPRNFGFIPVLGKKITACCFLLRHIERFLNIKEFNIFNFQLHKVHLLSNSPASWNGLMIYEWQRHGKVFK